MCCMHGSQLLSRGLDWNCLIDRYDQICRDFKPFYQLVEDDPIYFQRMIDRASRKLKDSPSEITMVEVQNGQVFLASDTVYGGDWPNTLGQFLAYLPNMMFLMNRRDEPRVTFNYRCGRGG
ncbi:hypothetical protein B0H10DRAFT_1944937 [Mycena sp. CBHHK59/15]|nr:hypothetical protein B0H10DRAFT_1944937 [Mycena sp. CBHHK59/15]